MSCYAYRESPDVEEDFAKHSLDVVETMKRLDEYEAFLKVLEKRYGVSRPEAEPLLRLAAAMHDLGKIDEEYQSACADGCTSFPGHYDASAKVLVLAYMRATNSDSLALLDLSREGPENYDALFAALVVIPVELHHYAQIEQLKTRIKFKPAAQCVNAVLYILKELELDGILGKAAKELERVVNSGIDRPREIDLPHLDFLKEIKIPNATRPDLAFIAEAATGLINMADGRTAKWNRQRCQ
ncbi:MAG: CRISPR-associated endonuclease Cas3'' [Thermoproteus sp.]|nr:CRISPR-associated endonuclease Cas3'' [Thermoproteus sp.]